VINDHEPRSFERRIVCVPDFLSAAAFETLRDTAIRQARSKRVHIPVHKRGETISYRELKYSAPEIVKFYLAPELSGWFSGIVGARVQPTPSNDLSSCSLLIYDRPNDHIGWHYDIDFYNGRHFTALLPLVNTDAAGAGLSSARLMVLLDGREVSIPTPPNSLVLFEGAHIYHSVTRLQEREQRIILSMTFCTNPSSGTLQNFMRRTKDIAYFGLRALWT
jgi:hypothetical protein